MIPHVTNLDDVRRGLSRVTHDGIEDVSAAILWDADSSAPDIGDGELVAYLVKSQQWAMLSIRLTVGSTTTFGSGNWFFVPTVNCSFTIPSVCGSGWLLDDSESDNKIVVPTFLAVNQIYVVDNADTFVSSSTPITWAEDDVLNFSIYYPLAG